jgi:hypothetical protein
LSLVGHGEINVADAQAAVPRTEAELAVDRVRWDAMRAELLLERSDAIGAGRLHLRPKLFDMPRESIELFGVIL